MRYTDQQIMEAMQKAGVNTYEQLALSRSRSHILTAALEACLKHFESEPTDQGHPQLIHIVKRALNH